jgi:pheromone shutdown-related protein TraB
MDAAETTTAQRLSLGEVEAMGSVTVLEHGGRTFWVVGTAHVSPQSVTEVQQVIDAVRPDTVAVELDAGRFAALTEDAGWKSLDLFKVIKEGKTLYLIANIALAAYQRRLGEKFGVRPGAELLAAVVKAKETGAEVALIDRDVHVTLKRTWRNLSFWNKFQILGAMLESSIGSEDPSQEDVEQLKDQANLSEALAEFARVMPQVKGPLIDERDRYLAAGTLEAAGERVVAIVGAAHVPGIREHFGRPIDKKALEEVPPPAKWVGLLKWIIPMLILAAFYVGYTKNEGRSFDEFLTAWILPNSIFCALLTALAGARFPSIVTGFIASPITSLNPLLPAGVVVGLVEAWLRKPTVADTESIHVDVQSVRGVYRNRFTRVLLVVVASTMGSAMGAWVGLGWVYSMLG